MNVDEIRDILHCRFSDIVEVEQSVLKAHSTYAGKPFALCVFDCTQAITREGFDLRAHQDRLLGADFHRVPGSLQWNLYCYFLCDEQLFPRIHDRGLVTAVESDREYARKFVRTPSMLRGELASLGAISAETKSELPKDVGSLWQKKLEMHGLSAVYSNLSYADAVRYIKSGRDVEAACADEDIRVVNAEPTIECIEAIDLGNFRQRPRRRRFEFGSCNLIYGVNGSGKTSLLEAIEAWMCGKNRRNPDEVVAHNCLKLMTRGAAEWQPGPSMGTALYRHRDHIWYGNYQARRNDLCFNFGRFSFYDSDAAARLEISEDDREIQNALSRLVLGEAATRLAERISRLLPTLRREERDYSSRVRTAEESIRSARASIDALEKPTASWKHIYEHFIRQLEVAGWRGESPSDAVSACLQVLSDLNNLSANIEHVLSELAWLREPSPAEIDRQIEFLAASASRINTLAFEGRKAQQEKANLDQQMLSFEEKVKLCSRWIEYSETGADQLPAISASYNEAIKRKRSLCAAKDVLARVDLQQYAEVDEAAAAMFTRIQTDLEEKAYLCGKAQATVASLEEVHGKIEGLISEVRARATVLFEVDSEAVMCPVCGARYRKGKLRELVQHQVLYESVPELQKAHAELTRLKEQENKLNQVLREIDTLQTVARDAMGITSPGDQPVRVLVASLLFLDRAIAQSDLDIDRLHLERANLEVKGFTEQEFAGISEQLASFFPDMTTPVKSAVANQHDEVQKAIDLAKSRQKEVSEKIDKIAQQERTLLNQHFDSDNATIDSLNTRMAQLAVAKQRVDSLGKVLVVARDQPLSDISVRIGSLRKTGENFVRLRQKDESLQRVIEENEAKIRAANQALETDTPVQKRLTHAVSVLEELTTEHGQESYVQEFFSGNLQQISNLFSMMHAPRDFDKVVWEEDNPMAIRAVRKSDSAVCTVSKLSSGQRNALSLAIFLTMNQKIGGAPSLILLDDPVAHVDDLNILSFFDCLREMLFSCKRQVFFATASSKTANLFRKKFDFLGENEFQSFQLVP